MSSQKIIEIKERIKRNTGVRLLCSPFMKSKYNKIYRDYLQSEDSSFLKGLKNSKQGNRCFIVCNGPSLSTDDLELIKNEYSFAFNRIYYIFDKTAWRPSFYVSVDKDVILMNNKEIKEIDVPIKFLDIYAKNCVVQKPNMHYICCKDGFIVRPYSDKGINFSLDISAGYSDGGTVTYVAIQLAVYMGFKEIYLLGVDHSYSTYIKADGKTYKDDEVVDNYFKELKSTGITTIFLDRTTKAYENARIICEENGVKIFNATRGGKLEAFERIRLEDIIMQ